MPSGFLERVLRPRRLALLALIPAALWAAGRLRAQPAASGLRVVVLERDYRDPEGWRAIAALGANVVATLAPPDSETDRIAAAAGLTYLAFLTTDEIESLARDPASVAEARAESNLAGFYFWDAGAVEGFTTPQAQQHAYETLKGLFPGKLVLSPARLDPIAWESGYLDSYFRPEFTDLVTPYFYPVGTTTLGQAREGDAWGERLAGLLSALAPRIPAGKGVLPVLQGFEQIGYPVGARFVPGQMAVYRRFWPDLSNAAVFVWKFADSGAEPLIEMAERPLLQEGTCELFAALSAGPSHCRAPREIPWR
jgi:hypothetical protein